MSTALGVAIRDAKRSDAHAIAEVHVASWRWAHRDDLAAEFLEGMSVDDREREWSDLLAPDPPGSGVLVAEEGGDVVGFCSFGPSRDEDATERTAEVLTIYLLEAAAGGASTNAPAGGSTVRRARIRASASTCRSPATR